MYRIIGVVIIYSLVMMNIGMNLGVTQISSIITNGIEEPISVDMNNGVLRSIIIGIVMVIVLGVVPKKKKIKVKG